MSTSDTYAFSSPQNEQIVTDAYERVGIIRDQFNAQKVQTAERSLNFILQNWPNYGNNLWTIRQGMIGLNNNQTAYSLPPNAIDVKTVTLRNSNRNLGGTPFSSAGGVAAYAFDGNTATACTQTAPNGYISYNWGGGATYAISMVGIQSNVTTTYTLACEYSIDGSTWQPGVDTTPQVFPIGQIIWFSVPMPVPASYFRVRETGGSTLNVQELYFNNATYDARMTRLSEEEYTSIPNKTSFTGRPSSFWVDRQINPIIYLWPTPSATYNNIYFTYWISLQDAGTLTNNPEVPARFLDALTAALAYRLGVKEKLPTDKLQMLQQDAKEAYIQAGKEDRERVPTRVFGDYLQGWSRQ